MPRLPSRRPTARKPAGQYHHGDLRRALIEEGVRLIGARGVEALTLREAGRKLGVSRTALYRHFRDKSALLAAVAREGFQRFRRDLLEAWDRAGHDREGLRAMGLAYVRFAVANPAHYRVMFGRYPDLSKSDPALPRDAFAAFQPLVDALTALEAGVRNDADVLQLAHFVWAMVHGVAMLAIDGQLGPDPSTADALARFAIDHLRGGIALKDERHREIRN
jgi:AcrR family transcriptional regulator